MLTRITVALIIMTAFCQIADALSVGRTPGQFDVSRLGAAEYNIAIWAPPGPRGVQPQISVAYSSSASSGPLGIGWSLAGLGQITRCNKTFAQDSASGPVALVAADGYCINGSRLRLTSAAGTYGAAGSTYQTEIADFSNITANSSTGITGIGYFMVQAVNGLTYYYGYTDSYGNGANSQALAKGTTTVLTWFLSKVVDRAGNNYVVNYLPATTTPPNELTGTTVPSKIFWTPTGANASTYSYTMQFIYGTNVPQSTPYEYVGGTVVTNNQLLTSIEILSGTTVVKDYFLGYQVSTLTGRKQLISVTECADSGASNCLSPTLVGYQTGTPGLSTTVNTALTSTGSSRPLTRYDFNGDGYPDLIYTDNTGKLAVAFGSATGYSAAVGTGITANAANATAVFGNLTGGIEDGILAANGTMLWYYTWNGTAFVGTSTGLALDAFSQYELADINGDGLPDLIELQYSEHMSGIYSDTISARLNTSTSGTASFSSTNTVIYSDSGGTQAPTLIGPDAQAGKLRRFDFNGDGLDDLVYEASNGDGTISIYELITTSTVSTPVLISTPTGTNYPPAFFTNWNDDKCTDMVLNNVLYVSACNSTTGQSYPIAGTVVQALDWDGDGRTDLLVSNGTTVGVYLSQATGTPTLTATTIPYSSTCQYVWVDANGDGLDDLGCWNSTAGKLTYYLHNGSSDLATSFADGFGNSASPTYLPLSASSYAQAINFVSSPEVLYTGPMPVVTQVTFSDPSSASGGTYSQTIQYQSAGSSGRGFDGFSKITYQDSRNNAYEGKSYLLAFPYTGMLSSDDISQGPGLGAITPTESTGTTAVKNLSTTTNEQRYFPYFSIWTVANREINGTDTDSGDLISTTSTNYTYDNYGNATSIVTVVTDNDPGAWDTAYTGKTWTTTTTNTTDISANLTTDLAAWCLNMLDETQVVYTSTLAGSTAVTRTQKFTPDTPIACRNTATITEPSSSLYKVTETLTFDSFGNIETDTVTGANMPSSPASRETKLSWGTTGQFLTTMFDPSNTTTTPTRQWSFTSSQSLAFGVPDYVLDANALKTSWIYDAFGRKTLETRPDSTSTSWAWSSCASHCGWGNSEYQVAQNLYQTNGTTIVRTDTNLYDPIDRITEISGPTLSGSTSIVQSVYNSLGLLSQQSMPFLSGATVFQQTYAYDFLNRLVESERPVNAAAGPTSCNPLTVPPISGCQGTNYAYAGRQTIVTDPLGKTTTTIRDVNGWLRQTQDAVGYKITRAFDAAGSLIKITDSAGNTLLSGTCGGGACYAYGLKPFRVSSTDADRGAWAYTVDSLGERIGWTDANDQSFAMTYDALSRPLSRTDPVTSSDPGLFTQWQYGLSATSHNIGQLISECSVTGNPTSCGSSPQYAETRAFDSLGRPSTQSITEAGNPGNDPGGVFEFTRSYSTTTGLLSSLRYPISTSGIVLIVSYVYQNGLLQSETCGATCFTWEGKAMNSFGQITQEEEGNGVVINRAYDAVTSWIKTASAGNGGGTALLNQYYVQDNDGNVTQRQDYNQGLTENFFYDADNRLTCATLSATCSTPTFVYDTGAAGPGNITTQVGVGTYAYPAPGQPRPHAVTSITGTFNGITNPTFAYDANGNMTNRASAGANITWSSYNYPTAISATDATGSEETQLFYGPDRQRWKQVYTTAGVTETTYYVGGLVEAVMSGGVTTFRDYVYAGNEPIAVYSRTSTGVNAFNYMLDDHLGGISAFVSNTGTLDINESFSAFGQRRNPANWTLPIATLDLMTIAGLSRQGYTFQTALGQSMGLNHMNGRVQDAILGRFLSPDPYIQDPSNAQNYNRYTYVLNNPLTFTDPTGFYCGGPPATPDPTLVNSAELNGGDQPDLEEVVVVAPCIIDFGPIPYDFSPYTPNAPLPLFPPIKKPILPPCKTFADDMAARRNQQTTSTADALAAISNLNDFLAGSADLAARAAAKAGQKAGFLEGVGRAGTFVGVGYTAYRGYVAIASDNPDAAYDAFTGGLTLAVARIPVVGPPVAFGIAVGSDLGQLISPTPPDVGPLSAYAATAAGQCIPQ
jgi:RHS repeat-associated protein